MKTPDVKLGFQTLFLFIRKTATREIRSAQKFKNTSNTQYLGTVVNFNSYGTVSCITQNNPHFSDNSPFWFPITVMTHSVCVHAGESLPRRDTTPLLHRLHRFFVNHPPTSNGTNTTCSRGVGARKMLTSFRRCSCVCSFISKPRWHPIPGIMDVVKNKRQRGSCPFQALSANLQLLWLPYHQSAWACWVLGHLHVTKPCLTDHD